MIKRRVLLAVVAGLTMFSLFEAGVHAGKGGGNGGGGKPKPTPAPLDGGRIYFNEFSTYLTKAIDPDGSSPVTLGNVPSGAYSSSRSEHGGQRWFLGAEVDPNDPTGGFPDGNQRDVYAYAEDGTRVRLTNHGPLLQNEGGAVWVTEIDPLLGQVDRAIAWLTFEWADNDGNGTPDAIVGGGIYRAALTFDSTGNITGISGMPAAADVAIDLLPNGDWYRHDLRGFGFSADGTRMAYSTKGWELRRVDSFPSPDQSTHAVIHDEAAGEIQWSPDLDDQATGVQEKIAFTYDGDVFAINPDGSRLKRIVNSNPRRGFYARSPNWSPNGSHLAYTVLEYVPAPVYIASRELFRVANDGSGTTKLADGWVRGWGITSAP